MENGPIKTTHLFAVLDHELVKLLRSLPAGDWNVITVAKHWTVKDVVAHLLDGNLKIISMLRDNYFGDSFSGPKSNRALVGYLNRSNRDWVKAMKRVSPKMLIELLENTSQQYVEQISLLNPHAESHFPVSWSGEKTSLNWFHIAREYTEKWHHQQQIRDAVHRPGLMTKEFYYPVLDTFMRSLPFTYRKTAGRKNVVVKVTINGDGGGDWFLVKKGKWELNKNTDLPVTTHTIIDGNIAWKLFTKSWRKQEVMNHVSITGDQQLGEQVLEMIAVMA